MKLVTVPEMRDIEEEANSNGYSYDQMMDKAGSGVADVVLKTFNQESNKSVLGFVGNGNNGGDTLVALSVLAKAGWKAIAYIARPRQPDDRLISLLIDAGGEVIKGEEDTGLKKLANCLRTSTVWLDGILGTGIKLPLKPDLAEFLRHVKEFSPRAHVVAVDCPSGVDCESGAAAEAAIPAEITVCMSAIKIGLLRFPAFKLVGQLLTVDLGLPDDLKSWHSSNMQVVNHDVVREILPHRDMDSHKGTFGTAMIIAGSVNYPGAALLSAKAAYRIGTGLVRLATPGIIQPLLVPGLPEATWTVLPHDMGVIAEDAVDVVEKELKKVTALLLGPGWGMEDTTADFLKRLIVEKPGVSHKGGIGFVAPAKESVSKEALVSLPPLVIDADALKLLTKIPNWHKALPSQAVLTPHPGEMSVLTGQGIEQIQKDRLGIVQKYACDWGHVVVLKGAVTLIADPAGRIAAIPVATSALAHAGTGDVLSGIITGLRAQGVPAFEAALSGAWIHAECGLSASQKVGSDASVLASDVIDAIPGVLQKI